MIPVKLTLQGLYSYRRKQTIDFENLTNAGIFGLFGGVGSGKSTILEAISFALYGESERLNARDNRNYNMMNLKVDELLIDFEFKTGANERYRFTVNGKRSIKQFDDVKTFNRAAYHYTNNQWTPIEVSSIEAITGLNYNNFKRTVIIPQGKFQEFLQLTAKDRTAMLMELFNLNKYDLSGKVTALELSNNEKIQNISGQIQSLGDIKPEMLTELKHQHQSQLAEIETANKNLSQWQQSVQAFEDLKTTHSKLIAQNQIVTELKANEKSILLLEEALNEFEIVTIKFKSDFEQQKLARKKIESTENQLTENNNHLTIQKEQLKKSEQAIELLKPDFLNKDKYYKRADDFNKLAEIKIVDIELQTQLGRKEKGTLVYANINTELENQKNKLTELKATYELAHSKQFDLAKLSKIKEWFGQEQNVKKRIAEFTDNIAKSETAIAKQKQQALLEFEIFGDIKPTNIDDAITWLEQEKKQQLNHLKALNKKRTDAEVNQKLQTFANHLTIGAPCPLCGSEEHPHPYNSNETTETLNKIALEIDGIEKGLDKLNQVEKKITIAIASINVLKVGVDNDQILLESTKKSLSDLIKQFEWSDYEITNPQQVINDFELAEKTKNDLINKKNEITNIEKLIATSQIERDKYAKGLENIELELRSNTAKKETLLTQISMDDIDSHNNISAESCIENAKSIQKQCNKIELDYQKYEAERNQCLQNISGVLAKIDLNEKSKLELLAELQVIDARISQNLSLQSNLSPSQIDEVLQKNIDSNAERKKIDTWKNSLVAAQQVQKNLQTELNGRNYDSNEHEKATQMLLQSTEIVSGANQKIGQLESQIKRLTQDLNQQSKLKEALTILQLRAADLYEMKNLFRSSAFVNYISTVYLEELCAAANKRFHPLTRNHLWLELASDNTFQVRDYMNEGKLRSAKTLSGGQTFQASLSLALALADSIRHLNRGNDSFFFLDEGFGTLDKETLMIVFSTLKALRNENRIVGIISHVEEMQQEIQTYLKIENSEEHGSVIKSSWN